MAEAEVTWWTRARPFVLPLALAAAALLAWDAAVAWEDYARFFKMLQRDAAAEDAARRAKESLGTGSNESASLLVPRPYQAVTGLVDLAREGRLHTFIIASLFRVTWGFFLAALVGIPLGLAMGWWASANDAFNPLIQFLRPISPIAWIPLAIVWFGLTEWGPIFLIFYSSFFPIVVSTAAAVRNIQPAYVRAARNFGLGNLELFRRVILPATLPQILTGLRIALGIAWLVVVAAEMVVTDARIGGLGYQIMDVRNSG
ncbi:MAG: ABC transporter permease, partial [Gemmataceae bacterium]|nr:ABC transporter permease [Gemmataceae bacterium]